MAETTDPALEAGDLPAVSVVIPTFGRPDRVSRAIDSVLAQTYARIEVVVVDDNPLGSEDQSITELSLRPYIDCQQIRYITRRSNGGGSAARNTGFDAGSGSLVTFLDDDDVYLPEKVEKQVQHMLAYGLDVSLCHMVLSENGAVVESPLAFARGANLADFIVDGNTFTPMIMVRRKVLTEAGGFPETPRFQDHLLMIKLLETGAKTGILDEALFIHDNHSGTRISLSKRSLEGYRNKHAFELRNMGRLNPGQRRSVLFRHATVGMKIARAEDGLLAGLGLLPAAVSNLGAPNDLVTVAKTIYNIVLRPNKSF
ncbi:glycosyltransferase family 2 protein [Arthrobacter sp. ISL-72]|uniref:glycosyltransferase family 2 protein n=1 Tax=Arthrobacter sp. ISL-72 TaxID=2819114 RepID=UPI001BE4F799|nr:glycosyltransferase family 2 protein [Arthrobacter sp. ISL-72]MBT2595487.1 glycosyltransferase family 2 protein [Arthrobacter sp. ISL-72]